MTMKSKIHLVAVLSLCLACFETGNAQALEKAQKGSSKSMFEEMVGKLSPPTEVSSSPLEAPIDQTRYVVGPGDILSVSLWGANSFSYTLTVTPEGTLIIPTVGELKVADTKLCDVKEKVSSALKSKYLSTSVTTTLISPRSFIITVTGTVLNQGQYRATPVDRVEKVVVQASRVFLPSATVTVQATTKKEEMQANQSVYNDPKMNQVAEIFNNISTRNILLLRRGGDTVRVDIPKFYATMNDRYNPFLLEGDIVFIPRRLWDRNFIAVYGAVNAPGKFEYAEGDSLFDALLIAQGVTPLSDLSKVNVLRMNDRGEIAEEFSLNLVKDRLRANVPLRRGDRVTVSEVSTEILDYRVQVLGEVRSPGYYPISSSNTRLSKLIGDAGGFTARALLSGSTVLRKQEDLFHSVDSKIEVARNLRSHRLNLADSIYFFANVELGRQPVVVDFVKLFNTKDSTQDIILQNGDVIFVPSDMHTVIVGGQVANPGHLPFIPGADYRHYIQKSGGFSEYADEGETKIIKNATLEWVDPGDTTIEPGDQIWVPKRPRREFYYYFSIARDLIGVIASVITAIYIVNQVSK